MPLDLKLKRFGNQYTVTKLSDWEASFFFSSFIFETRQEKKNTP